MKRAIVTGANGFVGSAVVKELSQNNIQVCAVVKDENEKVENIVDLPNVQIVYCSLADIQELPRKISRYDFDTFYHFAWVGSSGDLRGDYKIQLENARWTCDAVIAAKELGCKRFIFAASIMEYECIEFMKASKLPELGMMYHTGKIAADFMARTLSASREIGYISAVISNIYGPGEKSPRFINNTIRKILKKEKILLTACTQMYDFIYITDAARAFYLIGEKGISGKKYYIGNISQRPLKEFLLEMREYFEEKVDFRFGEIPYKGVSLNCSQLDFDDLSKDTGFSPIVGFPEGIHTTKKWIEDCGHNE